MGKKYPVITLCGSTRFKDEFIEVQKRLTLEGNILSVLASLVILEILRFGKIWMKERLPGPRKCLMICISE